MAISPFFTTNKHIPSLLNHLKKYYPTFDAKSLTQEKLFYKVFGTKEFIGPNYRKLISESSKLVRQFLLYQQNEKNVRRQSLDLLSIYQTRNIELEYNSLEKKLIEASKNQKLITPKYSVGKYELSKIRLLNLGPKQLDERLKTLRNQLTDLENFYKINKQIIRAELTNFKNITKDDGWKLPKSKPVLYLLYKKLNKLTKGYNGHVFEEAKNLLDKNLDNLSPERKFEICQYLSNSIIREKLKFPEKYKKPLFDFYKYWVDKDLVLINGKISLGTFINIIAMACQNNEFDWAKKFNKDYSSLVKVEKTKEALVLAKGFIAFSQKDFLNSIGHLSSISFTIEGINLLSRSTIIQCYFEISKKDDNYLMPLESQINSTSQWLSRTEKMNEDRKDMSRKFLQVVSKMMKYMHEPEKPIEDIINLKEYVISYPRLVQRIWLLDKVEELLKS